VARRSFSRKERARIFALRKGRCYLCDGKIDGTVEAFEIEHEIPWEISRDDSDDNLQLAHVKCHRVKTAKDRKDIAKVHRMAAKFNGTWPKSKTPLRSRGFESTRGALWPAGRKGD
jgi:hypothetical protein